MRGQITKKILKIQGGDSLSNMVRKEIGVLSVSGLNVKR